jgi:hypothetical protein
MSTITIDARTLLSIGSLTVIVIGALFTWAFEIVKRQVNRRMDQAEEERRDWQKEQVEDAIRASKGQMVMSDSLNVILRHMIYGNHVEDLEKSQRALMAFQQEQNDAMLRKAAKYNLR